MKQAVWITEAEVAALIDMGDAIAALERGLSARQRRRTAIGSDASGQAAAWRRKRIKQTNFENELLRERSCTSSQNRLR
jgi:hypothetical protein